MVEGGRARRSDPRLHSAKRRQDDTHMRLPEKDMNEWRIIIPANEIASFCQRWKIRQLALFGSVLRDDFSEESDLDVLVDFEEGADWGLLDHVQMQQELQALFQRNVDLISKRALLQSSNWLRRQEILKTARPLFPIAEEVHATG